MTSAIHRRLATLGIGIAAGLLAVPATAAARDPIAGGSTDLHLKKGFLRKLANNGVTVSGLGAGAVTGTKIGLSLRGGRLDPTDVSGFLQSRGGFKLERGNRGVPVNQAVVNTVKGAVYAEVAKAKMQLASFGVDAKAREGFGANFKATKLVLTEKAARRISNRLGLRRGRRISGGRVMSNLYSAAQPSTVTLLPQGSATLALDKAALEKLKAKGVEVPQGISAVPPATAATSTSLQLPIAGGELAPDGSAGTVLTGGGVQVLKKAEPFSPTLRLLDLRVDFATKEASAELEILPAPPFAGAAGRSSTFKLVLGAGAVTANPATRMIAVEHGEAQLVAGAASTLNDVFNQPAPQPPPSSNFIVGDRLAAFSLSAQAR